MYLDPYKRFQGEIELVDCVNYILEAAYDVSSLNNIDNVEQAIDNLFDKTEEMIKWPASRDKLVANSAVYAQQLFGPDGPDSSLNDSDAKQAMLEYYGARLAKKILDSFPKTGSASLEEFIEKIKETVNDNKDKVMSEVSDK